MRQHQASIICTLVIAHATNIARLNGYMNSYMNRGKPGTEKSKSPLFHGCRHPSV
jgi:hypothetical protein